MTNHVRAIKGFAGDENGRVRTPANDTQQSATFQIGDLAREFGVTLRALRFYEDRGLLRPRRRGAARLYTAEDKARLTTILKGKQLGFTLGEINAMLQNEAPCEGGKVAVLKLSSSQIEEQIGHLERQKADIEAAIQELISTRAAL